MKKHALYALYAIIGVDLWFHIVPRLDWAYPVGSGLIVAFGLTVTVIIFWGLKILVKRVDDG